MNSYKRTHGALCNILPRKITNVLNQHQDIPDDRLRQRKLRVLRATNIGEREHADNPEKEPRYESVGLLLLLEFLQVFILMFNVLIILIDRNVNPRRKRL